MTESKCNIHETCLEHKETRQRLHTVEEAISGIDEMHTCIQLIKKDVEYIKEGMSGFVSKPVCDEKNKSIEKVSQRMNMIERLIYGLVITTMGLLASTIITFLMGK